MRRRRDAGRRVGRDMFSPPRGITEMSVAERELRMAYTTGQPADAKGIRGTHELMFPRFESAAKAIFELFDTAQERASGNQVTQAAGQGSRTSLLRTNS